MRFTVADVEKFKNLLKNSKPTLYECMPPLDQWPTSYFDVSYILYSIDEFDDLLHALNKREEHMARYVFTATGKLYFAHEGEPGKSTPEYWQMLGEERMMIAAGTLFITHGKVSGLSDQGSCSTGLLSLIHTLRALHDNALPLALNLELIQSSPEHNGEYSSFITQNDLQNMFDDHSDLQHDFEDDLVDEEYTWLMHDVRKPSRRLTRPSSSSPLGGLFYNQTTNEHIRLNWPQSASQKRGGVLKTMTTEVAAPT